MLIPYLVKKGSFRPKFDAWIIEHKFELAQGARLRIDLGKSGGYPAHGLKITISQNDQNYFETDWEYHDWTRFPARIRVPLESQIKGTTSILTEGASTRLRFSIDIRG